MFVTRCHKIKLVIKNYIKIKVTDFYEFHLQLYIYRFYRIIFLKFSILYFLELQYFKFRIQELHMILDSQVYTALCIALLASVLAIQLGTTLYE